MPRLVDHGNDSWEFRSASPHAALAGLVTRYTIWKLRTLERATHLELPLAGVPVGFAFEGTIGIARPGHCDRYTAFVAGIHQRPVVSSTDGALRGLQIDFTPEGARRLLGRPLVEIADSAAHLGDVDPQLDRLGERIRNTADSEAQIGLIDGALGERLDHAKPVADALQHAHDRLLSGRRVVVAALASDAGWSRRHLTRAFRQAFGVTPRSLRRIVRLRRAAELLQGETVSELASVALTAGYSDQSHMTREFATMAGCTPTQWIEGERRGHHHVPFVQDIARGLRDDHAIPTKEDR